MINVKLDLAKDLLVDSGYPLNEGSIDKIRKHVELVQSIGKAFNVLSGKEYNEALENHVVDSLSLIPYLVERRPAPRMVVDLGSGGGFPGLVLAAALPKRPFTLVERSARKCAFLRRVAVSTGFGNVTILNGAFPETADCPRSALYTLRAIERPSQVADTLANTLNQDAQILWLARRTLKDLLSEKFHVEHIVDEWSRKDLRRGDLLRLSLV